MNNGVTVGADWDEISDWIDLMSASNICQRDDVVNVDEISPDRAVDPRKVKSADRTRRTMGLDAFAPSSRIPLILRLTI